MGELSVIAVTAVLGVVAWLYQTALARQERRAAYYFEILNNLPGFFQNTLNKDQREKAIAAARMLWLVAPPSVVRSANDFFQSAKGNGSDPNVTFKNFVVSMRHDTSLFSVMMPCHKGRFSVADIELYSG